jgi:hypothetical protein
MKYIRYLIAAFAVLTFTGVSVIYAQDSGRSAKVDMVVGDVEYRVSATDEYEPLEADMLVSENTEIRVNGRNDWATVVLQDGSEIRIMGLSTVVMKNLFDEQAKSPSVIELIVGRVFANVKRGARDDFRVETQVAVAAVRGTQFGMNFSGGNGDVIVVDGQVEVRDPAGILDSINVGRGQFTSFAQGQPFSPPAPTPAGLLALFGQDTTPAPEPEPVTEPEPTPTPTPVTVPDTTYSTPEPSPDTDAPAPAEPRREDECTPSGFNWSVSSEMIGGIVWNKVLLSPTIKLDNFTIAFYLPVYFKDLDNLFEPVTWYNGAEWDFGTGDGIEGYWDWQDAIHDLLMKIRFMSFNIDRSTKERKRNVYASLGNIPSMSIGHGILVDRYANDIEFPALRRVGFQFNMDFGYFGIETMMNDVYMTKLMGMRMFTRPFFGKRLIGNMGLGVSAFYDADPLETDEEKVWGYSVDLELLHFKFLGISALVYADLASLGFNDGVNEPVYFTGYGFTAGVKGRILIVDYRAEFRTFNNGFIGSYVDPFYDVDKGSKFSLLKLNHIDPSNTPNYHGFLISAGRTFEGIGGINLAYEQLFPDFDPESIIKPNNFLNIELFVDRCLFKKAYGSISYKRKNFTAADFFMNFFINTVVTTKIYYEIADGVYVGMSYKKFFEADQFGNINSYDTYALETHMGF